MADPTAIVPSIIILAPWVKSWIDNSPLTIGPWFLGTCFELFLQGVLVTQSTKFLSYNDPKGRSKRLIWLVIVLNVLCLVKTSQNIKIVWDTMITNYANPDCAWILLSVEWLHYTEGLSTALIAVYVQAFFVYRYHVLTKRWWLCVFIALCMAVSLIAAIVAVYYIPKLIFTRIRMWSLTHFVFAIVVDTLITSCTAWHLQRRKSAVQSTSDLINRLTRLVWQSALPPTICVIINAIVLESQPMVLTHLMINIVLPKLYAVSLLYTLNTRNDIRSEHENDGTTGYQITVSNRPATMVSGATSFVSGAGPSGNGVGVKSPRIGRDQEALSGYEFDREAGLDLNGSETTKRVTFDFKQDSGSNLSRLN
ncbi:hypothetical protein FRC19_004769 [Serendipita sp. 401]|nr:hypothetical protein FRC19_004769 [Serendipita sp. 401]